MPKFKVQIKATKMMEMDFVDGGTDTDIVGIMCEQIELEGRNIIDWLAEHAVVKQVREARQ